MTVKFSFSLLAPQKGGKGLFFEAMLMLCSARGHTEGTRESLESDIKATTDSHQKYLKQPYGKSQSVLCISLVAKGRFWKYLTPTATSLDLPQISSSEHLARVDWIKNMHLT